MSRRIPDKVETEQRRAAWRKRSAEREVRKGLGIRCFRAEAQREALIALLKREGDLASGETSQEAIEVALSRYLARQASHA